MKQFLSKKVLIFPLLALLGLFIIGFIFWGGNRTNAYAVYSDGKLIAVAKNQDTVKQELRKICQAKEKALGQAVQIKSKVEYKRILTNEDSILGASRLQEALTKHIQLQTTGATIEVNGKPVVTVGSEKIARQVLERLKKEYGTCASGEKLVSVAFEEQVKIRKTVVPTNRVVSQGKAFKILQTGTDTPTTYEVKEGDSLWLIARKYDTHVVDIKKANRLQGENLQLGQKLTIYTTEPKINVVAVVEGKRTEKIPYKTKVVIDRSSSSVKVKQNGKDGEKQVAYRVIRKNGATVEEKVTAEKILAQAVDRVIVKGKRLVVASRGGGSGILSWPIFGKINSYYGSRGGSHKGLDIDGNTGDPIRAADSGRVTFAGRSGGYGLMVEINHGNGTITRYAHCSRLLVSVGDRVSKGEVIARVGSTGHSTGSHLHFEVIQSGSHRNPLGYLR